MINLCCKNIRVRSFEERDIDKKLEWINNPKNNKYLHYDLPLEKEKTRLWFEKNKDSDNRVDAVIEYNGLPVGLIGIIFGGTDLKNKKAEYYICIGENDYKGKGIAAKATKMLLSYAFSELKLNKVYLYTEEQNIAAQRAFESAGFEKEGLLKEDLIYCGRKVNRFAYGITKEVFENDNNSNA